MKAGALVLRFLYSFLPTLRSINHKQSFTKWIPIFTFVYDIQPQ